MSADEAEEPGAGTKCLEAGDVNPKTRYPTDCICCCGFVAALLAMVVIIRQSVEQEHPFKILHPLDHAGNACGLGDYADYPMVYYPAKTMLPKGGQLVADVYYSNPTNLHSVCTRECPTSFSRHDRPAMCASIPSDEVTNATSNTTGEVANANTTGAAANTCTWYSEMPTKLFLNQYCILSHSLMNNAPDRTGTVCQSAMRAVADVQDEALQSLDNMGNATKHYLGYINSSIPSVATDPELVRLLNQVETDTEERVVTFKNAVRNAGDNSTERNLVQVCKDAVGKQKSTLTDFLADVLSSWIVLLSSLGVSLLVGAIYLLLVCFFVKTVVWGSCIAGIVGFGVGGWLFWDDAIQVADSGLTTAPASEEKILAVLCWLASIICLVIVVACRRALNLAIAISTATSSFLMKNAGIMILPQLLSLVQIVFILYWLCGLSAILSTAEILPAENVTQEYNRYVLSDTLKAKIVFHFFVGFWVHGFLEAIATITVGITVTEWYYKPKVNGHKPTSHLSFVNGLTKAVFFHSGSAAFGSLIVAVVQTIKFVLELYVKTVKQLVGEKGAKTLLGCCRCCLNFMQARLKMVSFNSYLMVGISGKSFCGSCYAAFELMARNPMRFVVFHGVMWTINAVGRLIIIGISLLWGALLMNKTLFPGLSEDVHSPWPVLICIVIIGWMVAGLIFGVFTTAGASLFYNFVCDEEVCKTSGGDSTNHAPGDLGKLLAAEAKRRKQSEKPEDDEEAQAEQADEDA